MREQLQTRLAELEQEFATGAQRLRELETEQARLRDAMLRIDGAMQVLRELIVAENAGDQERTGRGTSEVTILEPRKAS